MCRSQEIRYVHYMEHESYSERLGVGCVCAEKMSSDYVNPREREKRLRGKAGRRARWLTRKWRVSRNGNPYLKADGVHLVIFTFKQGRKAGKYGFQVNGEFGEIAFETIEEAKLAAFDGWWEAAHGD